MSTGSPTLLNSGPPKAESLVGVRRRPLSPTKAQVSWFGPKPLEQKSKKQSEAISPSGSQLRLWYVSKHCPFRVERVVPLVTYYTGKWNHRVKYSMGVNY